MTVISFDEVHNGRRGGDKVDGGYVFTAYRVFRAVTDDPTDDDTDVFAHASCPDYGDTHPNNSNAYVKSRNADNQSFSKKVWIVTIVYTTDASQLSWGSGEASILTSPAHITWRTEQFQKVADKDKNGQGVVNSAGDPYDPPPMRDDSRWTVTVTKAVGALPNWLLDYQDAVNSVPFVVDGKTINLRCAKMQAIELSDWQYAEGTAYRILTMVMTLTPDKHDLSILDQGFNEKDPADATKRIKITITDADGNKTEPSAPRLLNGAGAELDNPSYLNAKFNTHKIYQEKDFNQLPLV